MSDLQAKTLADAGLTETFFRIRRTPIEWPNGARMALTWSVDHEDYTDSASIFDIHYHAYGGKAGLWRIQALFEASEVKLSVFVNGLSAQRFPEGIRALDQGGHEVAGHGWANNVHHDAVSPEVEREMIHRTLATLEDILGKPVLGWLCPGWRTSRHTLEYLVERGCLWDGDYPIDDLPFVVEIHEKKLVVIPYIRESNDIQLHWYHRQDPRVWVDTFRAQFDVLYQEGETEPKMMNADVHTWLYGHPVGVKAMTEAIRYARGFPDVWWTTRTEIARWWLAQGYD
ncbi:MAG: polysaccharide deacetylase family protein [Anaerolineae bacterium]